MGEIARWGPMGFLVSPTKVVPFSGFTTSITMKTDNGNDTSGTATTNTRGLEPQQMSFSTKYMRATGVDPRERFDAWTAQMGQSYPLYIGNKRIGPAKMMLTSINVSELITNNNGDFLSVAIDITLQEEATSAASTASASNKDAANKAATIYQQTVENKRAMDATASASDKAAKKPSAS